MKYEVRTSINASSRKAGRIISALLFISLFTVCPFIYSQAPGDVVNDSGNYRLGVGDVLRVVVLKQAELSQDNLRISNEGTIRMPMLADPIPALCMTEAELSAELTEKYKKYLLNPHIYVTVREFNANPVAVVGAVTTPGRFQLQRPMRLLEVLTLVNGPSPRAGRTVQIIRTSGIKSCEVTTVGGSETNSMGEDVLALPLAEVMKGEDRVNPFVRSGDLIRVNEAEIKQAFIIGNVKAAKAIDLNEPVTLSRAIAMAGGHSQGAKIEKIRISRQTPGTFEKTNIVANLKDINNKKQDDILLEPNDVVDVPSDTGIGATLKQVITGMIRVPFIMP